MFRFNKIFIKIFISMFLVILFFSTVFSIYYITSQKNQIIESMRLEAKSTAKMIIYSTSDAIVLDDYSYIVEFNYEFLKQHDLLNEIILSKKDNYLVIQKKRWSLDNSLDKNLLDLEEDEGEFKIINDPLLKAKVFHYVYPIKFSGTKWGYIHLSYSFKQYENKIESVYYSFFIFFIILLFITFIVSYFIAKNFSRPIVSLNSVAKEIAKGKLDLRNEYESSDEIGQLSKSFNEMISKIEESQLELKNAYEKLEDRVEERTQELNEANRRLEDLNNVLDKRVKEELDKRLQNEKMLIQQSRLAAMGEMIGNIAHQWRQPLSIITTAATGMRLEREYGIDNMESQKDKIDAIVNTSNYLSNTIEDFSNFFKPNKEKEEFFINKRVEQALELIGSSLKFHYINVESDIEKEIKIFGFSNEYSQAILNIFTNSKDVLVQREIKNPTIYIKIYEDDIYGVLEVEDNAGGIDESIMYKIFDPYFTTKHQFQGTGIGLYMSKMIIEENMGGKIEVENGDKGAFFKVKVPLIKDENNV